MEGGVKRKLKGKLKWKLKGKLKWKLKRKLKGCIDVIGVEYTGGRTAGHTTSTRDDFWDVKEVVK